MINHTIIGDSSPLIALSIIGQLELLPKLYSRVVIPQKVWEEITVQGNGLPGASAIGQLDWLIIEWAASDILKSLAILLDPGEAEAIAQTYQGQGIGEALLFESLLRVYRVYELVGAVALFVDAKDKRAALFYQRYGFVPIPSFPLQLFLSFDTIRDIVGK